MFTLKSLATFALAITVSIAATGQSKQSSLEKHRAAKFFMLEEAKIGTIEQQLASQLGLSTADIVETSSFTTKNNITHTKYQQVYKGVQVIGGEFILHQKQQSPTTVSAEYFPNIRIPTTPLFSEEEAMQKAINYADAKVYMWQSDVSYTRPTPTLMVMDKAYPAFSGNYLLVYGVEIYSTSPLAREQYFINAMDGTLVKTENLMCTESVPASGQSLYLGEVDFVTDSIAPGEYHMIDFSRGNGNATYTNNGERILMTDDDNYWDFSDIHNRNAAVDAHFCTAKFYDLLVDYFDYSGLDGEGESMNCIVNVRDDEAFVNAFWDGRFSYFGNGDCDRGPLTSLDVVAHEFTHGLTDYTSDLVYQDEPGALNESMSDIFGKALEWYVTPDDFNWLVGDIFILDDTRQPFRDMSDPNNQGHPKYYRGNLWFSAEGDNGGVHSNSGVLNYWFYLIVEGGVGETEKGDPFDITGMGMEKAIQIPFMMQRAYLTRTSEYSDAYVAAIESTKDIYGEDSEELAIVEAAMSAIGLPRNTTDEELSRDLSITIVSDINQTCLDGELIDLEVSIRNVSTEPILIVEPISIAINNNVNAPREFDLNGTLQPDQDTVLILSEAALVFAEGEVEISVELLNEDGFSGNNLDDIEFENYFDPEADVELSIVVPSDIACYVRDIPIEAYIRNSSCNPIPSGTEYTIQMIMGGEVLETYTYTLDTEIAVGNSVRHILPYEYPGNVTILDFELEMAGDPNMSNNSVTFLPIFKEDSLSDNYLNTMDNQSDLTRNITLNDEFFFRIVDYNGESYLGTTGRSGSLNNLCTFWQDNFISGNTASMEMCVDMADHVNVIFSFDLIQLRNSRIDTVPELADEVTLAKIQWTDGIINEQLVINDQPDGEKVTYEIPLPDRFTGFITFDFYNHVGTGNFTSDFSHNNYDFNLLDNLSIAGDFLSSTDDINNAINQVTIFPNPTSSTINIASDDLEKSDYSIFTLEGKLVADGAIQDSSQSTRLLIEKTAN